MTLNKMILTNEPVEIEKVIQTTPSQMEIWLACKLGGNEANMAYNESVSVQLKGNLSVKSLQEAFSKTIQRHDGMRAILSPNGKHLLILSSYELPIRLRDISEMSFEEKERFLKKHSLETGKYQFNLSQGPLYVMELIKLDGMHYQLTFTGHHIIFDGWSLGVMMEELGSLYSSIVSQTESTLDKADDLTEYSVELINYTRKSSYKETKKFWTDYLSNPVPDLVLPLDKARPKYRTFECEVLEVPFEDHLLAKVREFSGKQRVSLNHTLLSAFEIFLSGWTGQDDVVVGLPVAGQLLMNRPSLIGHCVHLLPLRSKIDPSQTFIDYLQDRRKSYNKTLDYQAISFGTMVQDLQIKRDLSRIPLVPITFNIDMGMDKSIEFKGLEHKLISNPKAFANFEIIINLFGSANENVFQWTFNKGLFDELSIAAAGSRYMACLEKIVENPEAKIGEIIQSNQASKTDSAASVGGLSNGTDRDFIPFVEKIQHQFDLQGDQLALNFHKEVVSYHSLGTKSKSFAAYLTKNGIGPGDVVGIHLDRSPELIYTILGVLQAGAAYLPIDVDFPEDRVKFMLNDAQVKCFFTGSKDLDWGSLEAKKRTLDPEVFHAYLGDYRAAKMAASDPVFIIYTSGSTGVPKGVVLTQSNLFHFAKHYVTTPGIKAGDRVLGLTSASFDMHWLDMVMPFGYGASLFLLDRYHRIDSREIIKALEKHKITQLSATPSHLRSLVNHGMTKRLEGLRITSAGEPLLVGLADSLFAVCDSLFNIYGPSETTIFSTVKKVEPGSKLITIGGPVPGTDIIIVDEEGNLVEGSGKVGELVIGGTGVSAGYLNRPELNREKFIMDPFPTHKGRYYRSGDLGHWTEDGEIICMGRIDHQVKIRGQRVELGEIESKISGDPKVQHVAVLKYTDEHGDDLLKAFVSIKEAFRSGFDKQAWIEDCKASLSKRVASYMVPAQFVVLDQFPLNSNGKVDRNSLKSYGLEGSLATTAPSQTERVTGDTKTRVKALWEKVLYTNNIGLDDNFFEVGGHSLLAVELISLIERDFSVNLPLSILFEYPSIRSISAQIDKLSEENTKSHSGSLVKIKDGDPDKVLFFIHGVGLNPIEITTLIQHMDASQTIWGLQSPAVVDSTIAPLTNLEEIANYYISQIKSAGLQGPYNLMGNSIGGLIAFEMAHQLHKAGDQVSFLGMIDTVAFQSESMGDSLFGGIKTILRKLAFEASFILNDFGYYLKFRRRYIQEKWEGIYERITGNKGTDLFARIKHIEHVNMEAWKNYKHPQIDFKITLFLAERKTFFVGDPKTFGWSKFCPEVETIRMPGEHAEMLKPPHGEKFSKTLQAKLNLIK
ncbi:amino acid adenylation domain-containing protein [Algoriphagus sp. H41]|uniref:Amino acid adenylation domain-containing protein n=1 Tax=Algoriphagus oliviformis TaxID=2811231 RepID=A0ABS3C3M6_9BACT|nr:non-ribosomal peptide synthetase [Algoriphagus oliviformis]MBN7810760.1 amino acid adenylation domain-containing protein [Algoriphagus oliviformis]